MSFFSPAWLLLLIPWAAVTFYLLRGIPAKAGVPFLFLWPGGSTPRLQHRKYRLPPVGIILMLIATALAIVAAADPRLRDARAVPVVIIVDRGLSMSAMNAHSERRYAEAATLAGQWLGHAIPTAEVKIEVVPKAHGIKYDSLADLDSLVPTAVDTREQLDLAMQQALRSFNGPVIVLTDQPVSIHAANLMQIAPRSSVNDVAIAGFDARADPPQAMVRLLNASDHRTAILTVTADSARVYSATINLPDRGEQRNYFVDLPAGAKAIKASIEDSDNNDLTHEAWSVRRDAWPVVEARSDLSAELRRMIEVYARHRPRSGDSLHVAVVRQGEPISPGDPAVILAADINRLSATTPVSLQGPLRFPGVDWQTALAGASISTAPSNWQPVVTVADSAIVAFQAGPPKRIWVGFSSDAFARQAGYVVFWTEIFDWLGAGIPEFSSTTPTLLNPDWHRVDPAVPTTEPGLTPGIYQNSSGVLMAVNAEPAVPLGLGPENRVSRLTHPVSDAEHSVALAPALLFGAVLLSALALLVWPSFRTRRKSQAPERNQSCPALRPEDRC
jgi:hypothetical protein